MGPKTCQCQEKPGNTPVHIQHLTLCRTPRAKQNTTLGSSWWPSPAQPPPAPKQGADLNQSHFKSASGWTDVFPQQRESRANLSTERPTACLKNTIWSSFCYHRLEHVEKQQALPRVPMSKKHHRAAPPSAAGATKNTATFFLSHPPNSHAVQPQSRTFHTSQNKKRAPDEDTQFQWTGFVD